MDERSHSELGSLRLRAVTCYSMTQTDSAHERLVFPFLSRGNQTYAPQKCTLQADTPTPNTHTHTHTHTHTFSLSSHARTLIASFLFLISLKPWCLVSALLLSVVPALLLRFQLNILHRSHLSLALPLISLPHLSFVRAHNTHTHTHTHTRTHTHTHTHTLLLFQLSSSHTLCPHLHCTSCHIPFLNLSLLLVLLGIILPLGSVISSLFCFGVFFVRSLFIALSTLPSFFIRHLNGLRKPRRPVIVIVASAFFSGPSLSYSSPGLTPSASSLSCLVNVRELFTGECSMTSIRWRCDIR